MPTTDPYNYPIVASTPPGWYRPRVFVSGFESRANVASSQSERWVGTTYLYDPVEDAWLDASHAEVADTLTTYQSPLDTDPDVAGVYSHGAAVFHPDGPSGQVISASSNTVEVDIPIAGEPVVGSVIRITGGAASGQTRTIAANNTETGPAVSTATLEVETPWSTLPDVTSTYVLETGSFWCWRGNAQNEDYKWTRYDILQNTVEPKNLGSATTLSTPVLLTQYSTSGTGAVHTTSSITPSSDSLLIVAVRTTAQSDKSVTISTTLSNVGTWAQIESTVTSGGGASADLSLWYAQVTGSPGTGTVTATLGSSTSHVHVHVIEVTGHDTADPIGQVASATNGSGTADHRVSMLTSRTRNRIVGVAAGNQNGAGYTPTAGTELGETITTTTRCLESAYFASGSLEARWTSGGSNAWAAIAVEVNSQPDSTGVPEFVASTYTETTTVDVPTGTADGDLMVLAVTTDTDRYVSMTSWATSNGWTLFSDVIWTASANYTLGLYYRFASSEPASYSLSIGATEQAATVLTYRNAGTPSWLKQNYGSDYAIGASGVFGPGTSNLYKGHNFRLPSVCVAALFTSFYGGPMGSDGRATLLSRPSDSSANWEARSGSAQDVIIVDDSVVQVGAAINDGSATTLASAPMAWQFDLTTGDDYLSNMAIIPLTRFFIPPITGGMEGFGMADPSRSGGIHAVTDSDDTIWLGGDAQHALRRYTISTDTWDTLVEHEPTIATSSATAGSALGGRPLRNVGGGLVYQVVDGDPYLFCFLPTSNTSDPYGRLYAYDLTNDVWLDLYAQTGPSMPSLFAQTIGHNDLLVHLRQPDGVVSVFDPTRVDALKPVDNLGPMARPTLNTTGGTPFVLTYGDQTWLCFMEHTNVQGIAPLRCNITGRSWA